MLTDTYVNTIDSFYTSCSCVCLKIHIDTLIVSKIVADNGNGGVA